MNKKIILLTVCIVALLSLACTATAKTTDTFSDVPPNYWAYPDIIKLQTLNAISGTGNGTFNPEGNVTREQFLKILIDGFGITPEEATLTFSDVKKDAWYESYIKTGIATGIVTGKSADTFGIGENITRQDACVMVLRAMATMPDSVSEIAFSDKDSIAPYAKEAVSFLSEKSVVSGFTDNTFRPLELCTRSQAAKIISSAIDVEKTFFDGKRKIIFLGDSLTNAGEYLIYVNAFLKTRFPNTEVEVMFGGRDGETLTNMLERYDDDVLGKGATDVYILFGANDVNRGLYPNGTDESKQNAISKYTTNLETLITKLRSDGIRNITLLTPPALDEREYKGASSNKMEGISEGMEALSESTLALGKKYGLKVVDLNDTTTKILDARKDSEEVEIIKTDRIHPNRIGHFVMAAEIIENIYKSNGLVASVEVDTAEKVYKATNANVSNLNVTDECITYTYNPKAVPMGVDSKNITESVSGNGYSDAEEAYPEFIDFTDKMNREIIKVTGLAEGSYNVAFDGEVIATFTAEELAKGANIATIPSNPGQIKGKAVIDSFMKNYWTQIKVRRCEVLFRTLKKEGLYGADKQMITAWVNTTYPNNAGWESFLTLYEDYDIYKAQWDRLERNAYKLAQPGTYEVTISKVQ